MKRPALVPTARAPLARASLGRASLGRALCGAALLSGARALLAAQRFDASLLDPGSSAAQVAARELLLGTALALLPCLAVSVALGALLARRRRAAALAVALAATLLAAAFVANYLPFVALYAPDPAGARGRLALAGALAAGALGVGALRLPADDRARRVMLGALPVLALAAAAFVHLGRPRAQFPERPTIVLVSLDTTRADRLGCYGYELPTTPELDRFASDARVFERAHSHSTWTLTSHMSLFTGLRPASHGVDAEHSLANDSPTLAELLRDAGYATFAVVDQCPWIGPRYGFARGFELYRQTNRPAADKVALALELIDQADERPLLLFLHLFDAHSDSDELPYESAPEDRERFAGWYGGPAALGEPGGPRASELLVQMNDRGERLEGEAQRYLASLYDAGLRTLDRALGTLFRGLEERGVLENAVVVVTADHGEELYDHERALHGQHFAECVRVPLVVRTPQSAPGRSDALLGLGDVAPTLLELVGLELPGAEGRSFAPLLRGAVLDVEREHVLTEYAGRVRSVRGVGHALVLHDGRWRGFELASDPGESRPLEVDGSRELEALRAIAEARQAELDANATRARATQVGAPTAADRDRLEQLGYAGDEDG